MALAAPPELLGIHVNLPATIPPDVAMALKCGDPPPAGLSADEARAYEQLERSATKERAYAAMMGMRPQTVGYGLTDSPAGLAAWMLGQAPRSWAERAYRKLIYYNKVDKGGHFAAWEQPDLFATEVRAALRPLRA
jgi:pimeloyl-ACP methyl ester carboxylesterase